MTTAESRQGTARSREGLVNPRRLVRRGLKGAWWTVTLQLPRRLRAYRAYRSARRGEQE